MQKFGDASQSSAVWGALSRRIFIAAASHQNDVIAVEKKAMNIQTLPSEGEIEAVLGLDARSRRRKWTKRLIWLLVALSVLGAGLWLAEDIRPPGFDL